MVVTDFDEGLLVCKIYCRVSGRFYSLIKIKYINSALVERFQGSRDAIRPTTVFVKSNLFGCNSVTT